MIEFWNQRYKQENYAYGKSPNVFLKQELDKLPKGKALFAAAGEGRNAIYAASIGWQVEAFDQSAQAKIKADLLSQENQVLINYKVLEAQHATYQDQSFDLLVLMYGHFPDQERQAIHRKLIRTLKPGGILILEAFSKEHHIMQQSNPNAGGPQNIEMLYDLQAIKTDFIGFDFISAIETQTTLDEGLYHQGKAHVLQIKAIKK